MTIRAKDARLRVSGHEEARDFLSVRRETPGTDWAAEKERTTVT